MKRAAWIAVTLLVVAPIGATAQQPAEQSWFARTSRWAKWPALAGAVTLTAVALRRNRDADRVYDGLIAFCDRTPPACQFANTGNPDVRRYVGNEPETLYQRTLQLDGQARRWLVAGQVTLLLTGAMFLADLMSDDGEPENIPFLPLELVAEPQRVGLRLALPPFPFGR